MMFKTLFFILACLSFRIAHSKVEARWLTVASVLIDDGKTKLLFDPAWTRPEIGHWLGLKPLRSNETLVRSVLEKQNLKSIDAVFASHSHFDHVIDAPMISKVSGAVFYTDESSERLARAYNEPRIRTIPLGPLKEFRVGDFLITPIPRAHSKLFQFFEFLPGSVPADTNLSFWDYHVGESWFFLIKHPEGTILIDQGCESHTDDVLKLSTHVDVLFQGFASRKDDESILNGYLKTFKPKTYIPLHFDNFFVDFKEGQEGYLPGVGFDDLWDKIKKAYPTVKLNKPVYGQPITVLEIKR